MAKQYKIIKATYEKLVGVIFECAILNNMKAPKWFSDFVEKRFDPFVTKTESDIAEIKTDVSDLKVRMTNVENDIISIKDDIKSLKTDVNSRFDNIENRVTNLETKQ